MADWCTLWPDSNNAYDWGFVCKLHDEMYDNQDGKWLADWILLKSIWKLGARRMAVTMYIGVTIFGWIPYLKSATNQKKRE